MLILTQLNQVGPLANLYIRLDTETTAAEAYRITPSGTADALPLLRARGIVDGYTIRGLVLHRDIATVPVPKLGVMLTFAVLDPTPTCTGAHKPVKRLS